MAQILPLPPDVIAKIAAGEVIERPVSAVKELVENALDAGATQIEIKIEKSGLKSINLLDNGQGMSGQDLLECFKPHTTSKIFSENDLERIRSFGFRGEALWSLSAISRLTIRSKTARDLIGNQVIITNRQVIESIPVGMPTGTQVTVDELFENTPGRKKFLDNPAYEYAAVVNFLNRVALAFPKVGFSLSHNDRLVMQLPAGQSLAERASQLFGQKIFSNFIPVEHQDDAGRISGFIGKPQVAKPSRHRQFLFINQRPISSFQLSLAAKEAFGNLLEPRSHPAFLLMLDLPPETVDVNVHPRKEEVKFLQHQGVVKMVSQAIRLSLSNNDLTFQPASQDIHFTYQPINEPDHQSSDLGSDYTYSSSILKENTSPWQPDKPLAPKEIIQVLDTYLLYESEGALMLIDQHAAHERILYQQFLDTFIDLKLHPEIHRFPDPLLFDLTFSEAAYLNNYLDVFHRLGFEIETFGGGTFKINAIPVFFKQRDIPNLVSEILSQLIEEKGDFSLDRFTEKTISFLACRHAIKSGDRLDQKQRQQLLDKLAATTCQFTCPHGRPVQVKLTGYELEKIFRRR